MSEALPKSYEVQLRTGAGPSATTRTMHVESMRVALATAGMLVRKLTPPDELAKDQAAQEIIAELTSPDAENTVHKRPFYVYACEGFVVMVKRP